MPTELFAARAEDVGVTVAASDPGVSRIVDRLDGLPLAIELAAARIRGLSVAEIEQRLAERFRLLRGSRRGRVERHQTLWNTVAWSHQLLDPQERLVFDRLAVFSGGFTLEAATAVCAGDGVDGGDVEESILGLVERSMVLAEPTSSGTRYRLLETLRQFGEAKLIDDDTIDQYRLRHARWYANFATAAADRAHGVDGIEWCRRLLSEIDNYRAVVYSDDLVSARRVVAALSFFATASQSYEYVDWVPHVLEPPAPTDHDWIECALWGMMATHFVERAETRAHILSLLDRDAITPDRLRYVWLWDQYTAALGRHEPLEPFLQPLFDAASTLEDDWWRVVFTGQALLLTTLAGDLPLAGTLAHQLASDPARITVPLAETVVSQGEGWYRRAIGDATALDCFERSRRVSAECGFSLLEQAAASQQVPLLIDAGDLEAARRQIRHAIAGHIRGGDHLTLWQSLHYLVRLLVEVGEHDTAAEIWAELRDRGDWTETAVRAALEAQLGPPGQPKLTDNQLITRVATLMAEHD